MISSISTRLRVGIGAMLLALILAGLVSVLAILASGREVRRGIDLDAPIVASFGAMESSILRQQLLALGYLESGDAATRARIGFERKAYAEAEATVTTLWRGDPIAATGIGAEYGAFCGAVDALVAAADARAAAGSSRAVVAAPTEAALRATSARLATAGQTLLDDFEQSLRAPIMDEIDGSTRNAVATATRSIAVLGALALAAVAIGIAFGTRLMRGIRGPIAKLVAGMESIASGDKAARIQAGGIAEFEELESGFNDMAERLEYAEDGLQRSYDGQRKLLDEIPVGFLTFGPDLRIDPEYSAATERLFARAELAGLPITDLLFDEGKDSQREGLRRYLKQLFENTTADKDFLDEMNPVKRLALRGRDGEQVLAVNFDRIRGEEKVTELLATIEDLTGTIRAEEALEEERRSHKRDSDSIQAILSIGPGPLKDFFVETRESIGQIRERITKLDDTAEVNACFRLLHSIKGAAGSFGIEAVAMTAHEAENIFSDLRQAARAPSTQELVKINVLLGNIGEELDSFEDLVGRLKATLARLEDIDARGEQRSELEDFVDSLPAMIRQLEKSLAKSMQLVTNLTTRELPHLREMKTVMIHLVRNAADHGLEDEYERLFHGKEKGGTIKLSVGPKDGSGREYRIEVEDDGQGINFQRVAERGVEQGMLGRDAPTPDKAQLLALLFRPGFSTKESADEISGRGVGLDLVRDIVRSLGGSISVASARGRGTKFTVTLPA